MRFFSPPYYAALISLYCVTFSDIFGVLTHQSHDVPGVTPTEGLAAAEGDGDHDEDDEGAEVGRQVGLHCFFDHVAEGEHTYHAEGEEQLDGQDLGRCP